MPGPVTSRRERLSAGESRSAIDAGLRSRRDSAVFHGIHFVGGAPALRDRWSCALHTRASGGEPLVLSHRSAAVGLGLRWLPDAWKAADATVDASSARNDKHRQQGGLRIHKAPVDPCDLVVVDGVLMTSAARTLVDLVRYRYVGRRLGVALMDGALHSRACTPAELAAVLHRMRRRRGIRIAGEAVSLARCGVESPGETYLRLDLVEGGIALEAIDIPVEVREDDGLVLARGDLGDYDLMLWAEYDGYQHHSKKEAFARDRRGDRWLQQRGWHVMRFCGDDLGQPLRTAREWRDAARQAPARILAMDPKRSPELSRAQAELRRSMA